MIKPPTHRFFEPTRLATYSVIALSALINKKNINNNTAKTIIISIIKLSVV